jgi:DNA invertase Pin-like site-specific DNA recombinase
VLVVHKLDRFSRNLRVTLESLDTIGKAGVAFVSVTEQMDFSTPWGKLTLTNLGALAQFYSDNLSLETKKGKGERKAQGLYNGILPFGVMKGPDGVPKPHDQIWYVRDKQGNITQERAPTYEGLLLAFQLSAQGETDKDIARSLNARGYRTWGTHGSNPFSKDTVGGILQNRFYIGELPDEKGGWLKGKHAPIIPPELFEAAQEARAKRRSHSQTTRATAQRYSLSGITRCAPCGSRARVISPPANPRLMCTRRIDRGGCTEKSARLRHLEAQMAAYFAAFKLPQDYREKMLAYCRDMETETGAEAEITARKAQLDRIKELYVWGDMGKAEYLAERRQLQAELAKLTAANAKPDYIGRLAQFLQDLALAWEAADQEQRNRLASELFETVWLEDGLVLAVTPRSEMVPFFDLVYSEVGKKGVHMRPRRGTGPLPISQRRSIARPCPSLIIRCGRPLSWWVTEGQEPVSSPGLGIPRGGEANPDPFSLSRLSCFYSTLNQTLVWKVLSLIST